MDLAHWLVAAVSLLGWGGFLADAVIPATARQHLWNPAWPPHAKFHNAQTMVLGAALGTLALILLRVDDSFRTFLTATAVSSLYWLALLAAPLFPGTAWVDPEFEAATPRPLGLPPQKLVSWLACAALAAALVLESSAHFN